MTLLDVTQLDTHIAKDDGEEGLKIRGKLTHTHLHNHTHKKMRERKRGREKEGKGKQKERRNKEWWRC